MANSSIIKKAKNKIIKEFIKDKAIVQAINSSEITSPEKLKGTHIFDYHQNPNTINTVQTFHNLILKKSIYILLLKFGLFHMKNI